MTKPKYITPFDWSKKQLVDAWNEEMELKKKVMAERDAAYGQLTAARADIQSIRAKWDDATNRANREQGRADSAEAALKRAHQALVTAVERLGGR